MSERTVPTDLISADLTGEPKPRVRRSNQRSVNELGAVVSRALGDNASSRHGSLIGKNVGVDD